MKKPTKIWLVAVGAFVAYLVLAAVVTYLLRLPSRSAWVLFGVLAALGLISAGIILWYMRDQLRAPKAGTPADGIDATLAAARAQLAASKKLAKPKYGTLPVVLVLGPEGSTKTTTIVRSGLEPELLAGDVYRGETVAPTQGVNLWYASDAVIAEAGGRIAADVTAWQHLVRALRPGSFGSAITGKAQPPRLAVVCFDCDEFYKPGSGENVPAAARTLRTRLGEAARMFGVALPTYVVFTKADSVPHFDAFVRNLTAEEARDPFGVAVDPDAGGAGTYADRVTPTLSRSFDELYASLAEFRLQALSREHGPEFKPSAYEFPREFRKLEPLAVDFLREIGRPSELEVSPVLRGFYFTGVQAVFVNETTPEYVPAARQQAQVATARSATSVFASPLAPPAAAAAAAGAPASTRKVPRWDFLPRVMREVVFDDQAAVRLTAAGARVSFWRRLGFAVAAVIAVVFGTAFTISYSDNHALEQSAVDASRGIASLAPNPVDLPPLDALRKLDALRTQVDTLSNYEHDGAPMHLRWGLYSGSQLYPTVRQAYFAAFDKLMFAGTRAAMLGTLRALPAAPRPTDDYGETYTLLKAYIITTSHPEKSTTDFLVPALMTRWLAGRSADSARLQLARKQFETYATELRYKNPFPDTADIVAVARARSFLHQFAGSERIYQYMLAEAAKDNPAIQFNRKFPGSAAYVVDSYEVPGAFTKGGSVFMLNALKGVDKYVSGERWVIGDEASNVDTKKLVADLKAQYAAEYAAHWRKFLQSAAVVRYGNVKDAAAKLAVLSGNQSPLLSLLSTASQNTAVALPEVVSVFQPAQTVTPPTATDKLIGGANQPYVGALLDLQSALSQTAVGTGKAAEDAAAQASSKAAAAKTAALQLASGFTVDQQGNVQRTVQSLLEAPITNTDPLLQHFGADAINVKARQFCGTASGLLAKYPFNPDATQQATVAEVTAMFKPVTGSLWRFYNENLQAVLPRQGNQYVPAAGDVKVSTGFVQFMNHAQTFTDALFKDENADPHLAFTVEPSPTAAFPTVSLTVDGELFRSSVNGNMATARLDWPNAGKETKLTTVLGTTEVPVAGPFNGTWALFQLFGQATDWRAGTKPGSIRVGWELTARNQRGQFVVVQLNDATAAATVLRRGLFSGSSCTGDIAQ